MTCNFKSKIDDTIPISYYITSKSPVSSLIGFVVSCLIGFADPNDEDFLLFDGLAAFHRLMNTRIPIAPMQIAPPAVPPRTSSG